MPKSDIETYNDDSRWKNKVEGSSRASSVHQTKAAAVAAGRQMAMSRKVEHIIRKMDGTIGDRNSYGNDPRNIRANPPSGDATPIDTLGALS
jgi:hypothetical protein